MGPTAPAPTRHKIPEEEIPGLYHGQGWRIPAPVTLAALFVAGLAAPRAPMGLVLGWLGAVVAVLMLRHVIIREAARHEEWPIDARINAIAFVSFLGGVVHGQSVLFWPYMGELERAIQTVFVLGLAAGAVATEFGHPKVFLGYLVPMLLPLTWTWARELAQQLDGRPWWQGPPLVLTALFCIYGALLTVLARDTWRLFRDSFESRRQLQAALDRAESANRAKTRFLASASHDLRQPMHTLSLFGAALSMRPLDERSRAIAQQMNQALQALGSQLDALLDVSKLDAGIVDVNPADVDLDLVLRRLHDEFVPVAQRRGLVLRTDCPAGMRAHTDALLLDRVLRNLLDNALKYTHDGEVRLRAEPLPGGGVLIEVADTGPGIAAAEQDKVFEEFYQLGNPERDRRQGLGLGLSIVRRLSELLGLGLQLHSAPGAGTRFRMTVPAARALPAPPPGTAEALPSLQGLRVLVVDDEEAVREGMRTLLEAHGCHVDTAGGTDAAVQSAGRASPDVVLVDFRLRDQDDGLLAVRRLREQQSGLPALLISGDTAPERLREARSAGLKLLHKPVAADVLVHAIHAAVTSAAVPRRAG